MDFIVTVDTVQPFSLEHGILTVRIELLKNLTKFDFILTFLTVVLV